MNLLSLVFQKLKAFRMSVPSLVLLVLASWRTLTSGDAIVLVGVCASIVPFMCQFKNFPTAPEGTAKLADVLSNYILNILLMVVYLAYILVLTRIGKNFVPGYTENPHFMELLLIAVCADMVFISAVIPVCQDLNPFQRIMPGIILTNAMLVFMMMAKQFVAVVPIPNLMQIACGFIALILVLTLNFMVICYKEKKKK